MEFKSHFTYNKQQRSGILLLLLLLILLLGVYWFVDFSKEDVFDTSSEEVLKIQQAMDSVRLAESELKQPKIYPFNPNFITDFRGYTLGMSTEEIDRLLKFRAEDKWINSVDDFQKVTGVSDSLLKEISPYFQFPEWVTETQSERSNKTTRRDKGFVAKSYSEKIDLNEATAEQLQQVSGIGEVLSNRIIAFRDRLDGFSDDAQLYAVYGLDSEVAKRVLNLFTVKTPKEIEKINVNTASASDIATIPTVSFELAKNIWEYRRLRERIESVEELAKIEGMTESKLKLIKLYLSF